MKVRKGSGRGMEGGEGRRAKKGGERKGLHRMTYVGGKEGRGGAIADAILRGGI